MYDYKVEMRCDILEHIAEDYTPAELFELLEDPDALAEKLNDEFWTDDSVTGNASGSYFCNSYKAREAVCDNMALCIEALREFCTDAETIAERFLREDWEYFDVTIRCYLLYGVVWGIVEDLADARDAIKAWDRITADALDAIAA